MRLAKVSFFHDTEKSYSYADIPPISVTSRPWGKTKRAFASWRCTHKERRPDKKFFTLAYMSANMKILFFAFMYLFANAKTPFFDSTYMYANVNTSFFASAYTYANTKIPFFMTAYVYATPEYGSRLKEPTTFNLTEISNRLHISFIR